MQGVRMETVCFQLSVYAWLSFNSGVVQRGFLQRDAQIHICEGICTKTVVFFVRVECFLFSFSDCMTGTVGMNASKVGEWWATQGSGLAVLGLDN